MDAIDPPPPETPRPRRGLIIGGVVAAVLIILGAAAALWQLQGDDTVRAGEPSSPTTTTSADTSTETSAQTTTALDKCAGLQDRTWIAAATDTGADASDVTVYDQPDGQIVSTVENPWRVSPDGSTTSPAVFVVRGDEDPRDDTWLHVDLPTAPTGSEGYILAEDVTVDCIAYRITVNRAEFTLTLTLDGEPAMGPFPVGLSRDPRATQAGSYFVTELVTPTDANGNPIPNSDYGTGAYGINGYSDNPDLIQAFPETGAQVGIHGTNDPGSLPGRVSSGCIRLRNQDIDRLQTAVPLGTPVDVI